MPPDPAITRVHELRDLLNRASRAYYVDAAPIMPDAEFDRLLEELAALEEAHPELHDPSSPTRRVGGEPIEGFETVPHTVPMLSIENTYNDADVRAWVDRVFKRLGAEPEGELFASEPSVVFASEPKVDGVAVSLRYERGELVRAVTRGDGTKGDDVTHTARTVRAIPLSLAGSPPERIEIRGELFIPDSQFERINRERVERGEEPFMNARNACAGTIKQLDPTAASERRLGFIAHGLGELSDDMRPGGYTEYCCMLRHMGVPTSPHARTCRNAEEILDAIRAFEPQRRELDYATDGMVIRVDGFAHQAALGQTSKHPRWAIAFKFAAERTTTTLVDVQWQVGKTGKITPRAVMEPVVLAGTTVRHASLHNLGQIRQKDIHLGDTVVIEKAGEIIPYVVGAVASARPDDARAIEPPKACPVCDGTLDIEPPEASHDEQIETRRSCVNPECPAQLREKLVWFAGRDQMDIEGLGESTIDLILSDPEIPLAHFGDIFRLDGHRERLIALERMGEKKVENLLRGVEDAKGRGLARVLAGMGIRNVGSATAKLLARRFGSLDALLAAELWELMPMAVNRMTNAEREALLGSPDRLDTSLEHETGLGKDTAPTVHAYLQSAAAGDTFDRLRAAGVRLDEPTAHREDVESEFTGTSVVLTGTLERFGRKELAEVLEGLGAKVSGSVSSRTNLLIAGEKAGSKLDKARELGVEVWDETRLLDALERAGVELP